MSVEKYLDLSRKYLGQAREIMKRGDYAKAGEMLWGATAEMVKALAFQRGVELKSHGEIWEYIAKLSEETEDREILKLFHVANSLHTKLCVPCLRGRAEDSDVQIGLRGEMEVFS